jgi:hypothetical protein
MMVIFLTVVRKFWGSFLFSPHSFEISILFSFSSLYFLVYFFGLTFFCSLFFCYLFVSFPEHPSFCLLIPTFFLSSGLFLFSSFLLSVLCFLPHSSFLFLYFVFIASSHVIYFLLRLPFLLLFPWFVRSLLISFTSVEDALSRTFVL